MDSRARTLQEIPMAGCVNCASLGRKSGRIFATGGLDNKVNIWAVGKNGCIMVLSDHVSPIQSLNFDNDENRLCAGAANGSVKVWELETAKEVRTFPGHKSSTTVVEFHPNITNISTGSTDSNVKVWDIRQKTCVFRYKGHTGEIKSLKVSPEGSWLVSGATDNTVKIWDITAGKMIKEFTDHTSDITDVQFHPSVLLMATSSKDRTVKIYDLETFSLLSSSPKSNAAGPIERLCFHPNGDTLYASSTDCLKIFNTDPLNFLESVYVGWQNGFNDMAFSTSNKLDHQIIGLSSVNPSLSTYVIDIDQCAPFQQRPQQNVNSSKPNTANTKVQSTHALRQIPADPPKVLVKQKYRDNSPKDVPSEQSNVNIMDNNYYNELFGNQKVQNQIVTHEIAPPPLRREEYKFEMPEEANEKGDNLNIPVVHKESRTDEGTIQEVTNMHKAVYNALCNRKENVLYLKRRCQTSSICRVVEEAVNSSDKTVVADVLAVLLQNEKLLDFNVAHSLMPQLLKFTSDKHEHYMDIACQALKLILTQFSGLISDNISNSSAYNLKPNIAQEERRRKCQDCYEHLKDMHKTLSSRQKIINGLSVLNEVVILLNLICAH